MTEKRYCSQCGTELRPNARYCSYCGTPVKQELNGPRYPVTPVKAQPLHPPPIGVSNLPDTPPPPKFGVGKYIRSLITNPPTFYEHMEKSKENLNASFIVIINLSLAVLAIIVLFQKLTITGNILNYFTNLGFSMDYLAQLSDALNLMVPLVVVSSVYINGLFNLVTATLIYWIFANISGGDRSISKMFRIVASSCIPFWILGIYQIAIAFLLPPQSLPISYVIQGDIASLFAVPPLVSFVVVGLAGLWQGVLIGYGLHYAAKISGRRAMTIGIGYWLFVIVLENILPLFIAIS